MEATFKIPVKLEGHASLDETVKELKAQVATLADAEKTDVSPLQKQVTAVTDAVQAAAAQISAVHESQKRMMQLCASLATAVQKLSDSPMLKLDIDQLVEADIENREHMLALIINKDEVREALDQ